MEKRSRQRVRDQVAHLAFGAESRMRSSARGYPWWPGTQRSVQGPDTDAQDQLSPDRHFRLATRGRSIQTGQQRKSESFDHLVGGGEEDGRNIEAERPGCLEIDDQLELGRLFDRQICRLGALKYLVHQPGDLSPETVEMDAIGHQATFPDRLPKAKHCRQPVLIGESQDARSMDVTHGA